MYVCVCVCVYVCVYAYVLMGGCFSGCLVKYLANTVPANYQLFTDIFRV